MALDFAKLLTDAVALKDAIASGDGPDILDALGDLSHDGADAWRYFATPKLMASAKGNADLAKCIATCDEIVAQCTATAASPPIAKAGASVGALWDGTILKLLLANLPALIDIFKQLFGG